jgi:putative acetyltransferase
MNAIKEPMQLQPGIFPVGEADFARVIEVWEASVRATHDFVSEADIQVFRPLLQEALPQLKDVLCVRDLAGQVAGFMAVVEGHVEMLFLHPDARGMGAGKRLLQHAITRQGATMLDVNEQNEQALGFYLHMGFEVVGRSERDSTNKPYPLLHMRLVERRKTGAEHTS